MTKLEILAVNIAWRLLKQGPHSRPQIRRKGKVVVVPFAHRREPGDDLRIAAVLHIFYPDTAAQLRAACETIGPVADIFVTTDAHNKAAAIRSAFAGWDRGEVTVKVCPNRGRDMLSKFVAFPSALQDYDLLLFLHSKKSVHLGADTHDWGGVLTQTLVGSPAIVESIRELFAADPKLGVVSPDHYDHLRRFVNWGGNRRPAEPLARRIGVDLAKARALDFPSGSMFWARPAALKPLFDLALTPDDFPDELGQVDGTLAHVLERLILFAAEKAGFHWLKIVTPEHYADRGNRVVVASAAEAAETIRETAAALRLTA